MSDNREFIAEARQKCAMSIRNTAVGDWLGDALRRLEEADAENQRLEMAEAELLTAEQTGHKWFKLASDRRFEIERLQAKNERLRAIIDKLTAKAPATASLAVFLCSQCGEAKDTVYDLDTGQVCANCIQSS